MLVSVRRDRIVELVRERGSVHLDELARELSVSTMTVRRDVDELSQEGRLVRVRGGAIARQDDHPQIDVEYLTPVKRRLAQQREQKDAIAATARGLIEPGMAIALSAGSSTYILAEAIRDIQDLTIVTNSLDIADVWETQVAMDSIPNHSVVLVGGMRTASRALVGPVAVRALTDLHCDLAFLSVHGLDRESGLTTPNILEAETNRALLRCADRSVVLADHTKWRTVSLTTMADLDQIDLVVTDSGLGETEREELRSAGPEVLVADVAG